jgi:hypothetical protein
MRVHTLVKCRQLQPDDKRRARDKKAADILEKDRNAAAAALQFTKLKASVIST